jgi:hypothetical protein
MVLKIGKKFQQKRMFSSRDNECTRKLDVSELSVKCESLLQIHYLGKETSVFAETFNLF